MLGGALAACGPIEEETGSTESSSTESATEESTSCDSSSTTESSETETVTETETETESDTDSSTEVIDYAEGLFGPSITVANKLANGVQTNFSDENRTSYVINNYDIQLEASLGKKDDEFFGVTSLKNRNGGVYLENTMDVFVRMKDGKTYYASQSTNKAHSNVYRLGYYYYDVHIVGQDFLSGYDVSNTLDIPINELNRNGNGVGSFKYKGDELVFNTTSSSCFFWMAYGGKDTYSYSADDYNVVQFTLEAPNATSATVWYVAGGETQHNTPQRVSIELIPDGKTHTYTVLLSKGYNYSGTVSGLRFDFSGNKVGDVLTLSDIKLGKADISAPILTLDRTFHTYPDKLHQSIHFSATGDAENIDALGMITEIAADTVNKLVVKADGEVYTDISKVKDWASAEYVGFDIKNAGIFGYILANHETSGTIKVTLEDGKYVIIQESAPEGGVIKSPKKYTENDFYMGQRLYTDDSHSFDKFIAEAEFERDPAIGITASTDYLGYNPISGAFEFKIGGSGFNPPYYYEWNRHYTSKINVKTKLEDLRIYIRTIGSSGCLEGAALLDKDGMLLPIPLEVSKNFEGENEEPIVDFGDKQYGETLFPIYALKNTQYSFTVVNAYQNWGNYPLKQISSIQYFAPYYHLSTGVTESSCIAPWYNDQGRNLWTLPDFRSMSAPLWDNQPQHSHGGIQYFLQYTDSDGKYNASENYSNIIGSSGLSYSEVLMSYISDDEKIKVDYNHIEFPQNDEMRAFYEMNYEVLEDVKITDFKKDFSFYSCKAYGGTFTKLGYLNADNEAVNVTMNGEEAPVFYKLGDKSPYAAFYDIKLNDPKATWVNVGIVIHSYDITIGGEKYEGKFSLMVKNNQCFLSLDLGEVTLKKGDKFTINMIIVPWGDPKSETDINMQNVRQDSAINPLSVTVTKGEKIESPFVPRVKTDDGKSAEFTLKGGANNVAVRVYGFNKLTAPKIYEKIDGKWVPYTVNSADNPDPNKNYNYYDGYYAFYDEDGTYSYSFVTNMTEKAEDGTIKHLGERTFKIVADEDFVPWPVDENKYEDPLDLYVTPTQLYINTNNGTIKGMSRGEISQDGTYVTFYGDGVGGHNKEVTPVIFSQSQSSDMKETGRYIVLKYRVPSTNKVVNNFEFYIATNKGGPDGKGDSVPALITPRDDKWKIAVFDLEKLGVSAYMPNEDDGKYYARFLRFDIFNLVMGTEDYVDIGFVGMTNDFDKILALAAADKDIDGKLVYVNRGGYNGEVDVATGTIIEMPSDYIKPSSGYHLSKVPYGASVDYIVGLGPNGSTKPFANKQASLKMGPVKIAHNSTTLSGTYLFTITGWNVVQGNIERYVWSVDGGKTWNDASVKLIQAGDAIRNAASGICGKTLTAEDAADGVISGNRGVAADLTAYAGQTVDITIAAVPKDDPMGLCLVLYATGVTVSKEPISSGDTSGD